MLDTLESNKKDVVIIIEDFLINVSSFPDEDFFKIIAYVYPKQLDLKRNEKKSVEKNIEKINFI